MVCVCVCLIVYGVVVCCMLYLHPPGVTRVPGPGPSSPVHTSPSPHRLSVSPLSVVGPELGVVLGKEELE